jgi:hypothetical protein
MTSDGRASADSPAATGEVAEFALAGPVTTIGGDDSQDIQLPGLTAEHAQVTYDADSDEYVFRAIAGGAVDAAPVETASLHNGDRVTVGAHTLVFQRDEHADHVRSGEQAREGGEYAGGGITGVSGDQTEPG